MKLLTLVIRLIVSFTFIFSGFVKLVDPLGSSYKFQEYFSSDVLNLEFLIPYALPFSIILIIAELMLGVMLLLGYLPKFTVWSLFFMMLIFLFLTWYSAYFDKVLDCGCFGDALKLTPWATFYKNVALLAFILILLFTTKYISPLIHLNFAKWTAFLSFLAFFYVTYHVLVHLPIIDFRPYAIGKNIPDGMKAIGAELPPIHDFYLESNEGLNVTDEVLKEDKMMLIVSYNLDKSDRRGFSKIKNVTDKALKFGYKVYLLSASLEDDFIDIKDEFDLNFDMLFCDETTLKTIIRANPGIVMLNKGIVTGKWNWVDAEDVFDK
ncbi:MauE/DoxX family redox-associated membrane protein [Lutibacter sp.]|uniref:MauE/DoxX family redox-associated membrane protein n=1 Tax=Lutibacter sp. TaxID=1925666 RepID=UPI0035676579